MIEWLCEEEELETWNIELQMRYRDYFALNNCFTSYTNQNDTDK
jgi:hypothetical protein